MKSSGDEYMEELQQFCEDESVHDEFQKKIKINSGFITVFWFKEITFGQRQKWPMKIYSCDNEGEKYSNWTSFPSQCGHLSNVTNDFFTTINWAHNYYEILFLIDKCLQWNIKLIIVCNGLSHQVCLSHSLFKYIKITTHYY